MIRIKGSCVLAALLTAAACFGVQAAEPIRIGAIISKTGPASFLGEPQDVTLRHYVKQINDAGGVLGRPLELTIYDDATDANTARTFASRLVDSNKVVAAMGPSTTGITLAVAQVFEDARVPLISLAAGIEIVEPVRPYVFKTPHTDRMVCRKQIADLKARGYKRIAMINGTDGAGKTLRNECTAAAKGAGIEIAADETFNPTDSDMTPQLTKIRNRPGVEAILVGGFGQALALVTRNYGQLGIKIPMYQAHGAASKAFIKLAGPASEGVRVVSPLLVVADKLPDSDPVKKVAMQYDKTIRGITGAEASTFGGYSHDALMLIVDAIKRAGSAEPKAIRDALEATRGLVGVTGVFNMSPTDHLGIDDKSLYMVDIRNGEWRVGP
ncbi:MAG: ABC transporter substrate-binding protein [Burkholderiaceae bacterium]